VATQGEATPEDGASTLAAGDGALVEGEPTDAASNPTAQAQARLVGDQTPAREFIKQIEAEHQSRVLAYHGEINDDDSVQVYRALQSLGPCNKITLILGSPGGSPDAAYRIVQRIREFASEFEVVIGGIAASAATLVSLGADKIIMGPGAEIGPVDAQVPVDIRLLVPGKLDTSDDEPWERVVRIPAQVIRDFFQFIGVIPGPTESQLNIAPLQRVIDRLDPVSIGWYERVTRVSRQYATELLQRYLLAGQPDANRRAEAIASALIDVFPSHNALLSRSRVRDLGIPVEDASQETAWASDFLYSFYDEVCEQQGLRVVIETATSVYTAPLPWIQGCPECDSGVHVSDNFCYSCGYRFQAPCLNEACDVSLGPDELFCSSCGTRSEWQPDGPDSDHSFRTDE
jgi:hypothetical protein